MGEGASSTGLSTADLPPQTATSRARLPTLPTLTILAHPQLERIGDRVVLGELLRKHAVFIGRRAPSFRAPGARTGKPLADRFISRHPIRLETTSTGAIRLTRDGSPIEVTIDGASVDEECLLDPAALERGVVIELSRRLALLLHRHPADCDEADGFGLIGASAPLATVRASIRRLAGFDVPVLVRGETGSGKELVARALHQHGSRRDRPFVAVSVAALPPSLAAAELFGATRGAYTGATRDRVGYFERADGGTLFLDEIGEADPEIQVMLLRALESGEILPAGATSPRPIDVRVVSATDADLECLCREGRFRAPLLHRLAGYTLRVPPLRERRDDIGRLLLHFLKRELERSGSELSVASESTHPWLPTGLVSRLCRADWPGNVRQLANVARQLVIDGREPASLEPWTRLDELLADGDRPPPTREPAVADPDPVPRRRQRKPAQLSEDELLAALRRHRFNLKAAASSLGVPRTSLYALIERSDRVRTAAAVPPEEIRSAWRRTDGNLEAMVEELEVSERALRQRLRDLGLR